MTLDGVAPSFLGDLPFDPTFGYYGEPVFFCAYVNDSDGDSINVTWEWGDGSFSYNNTPADGEVSFVSQSHTYAPPIPPGQNAMELTLNITLDDGNGNTACRSVSVILTLPHNFSPQIDSLLVDGEWFATVDPGDTVQISASASDQEGEPLTWTFVFNDSESDYRTEVFHTDATAPGELVWCNLTHVFGTVVRHYVALYVSDALVPYQVFPHNVSLTVTVDVEVNSPPFVGATIGVTPSSPVIDTDIGYVEVSFLIVALDTDGDVLTVTWDFGDGSPVVENVTEEGYSVHDVRQKHSYFDTGVYNVTVVVTDGRLGHEVTRYLLMTVTSDNLPPIFVQFSYTGRGVPLQFNYVGDLVRFSLVVTDPEQDPIEFTWDFGDGSPLVVETVSEYIDGNVRSSVNHTYLGPGWFSLTVTYTDNQEGVGEHTLSWTEWMQIIEDETSPLADAGPDQVAFVGDVVTFDGSGSHDNWAISNYTWTFVYNGTEKTLWGVQPQFQFWTLGLYPVVLNVTDMVGNYNTSSMYVAVYDESEIPEFGSAVSVAMTMMLAFVAMAMIRRRRR